ncbi:hypothetical protein PG995_000229 [Apiospora arundinis]
MDVHSKVPLQDWDTPEMRFIHSASRTFSMTTTPRLDGPEHRTMSRPKAVLDDLTASSSQN